jgi:UDP-N-acetylmuramoyl-tripeptide--D-alanyl-D-alanine ligase
MTVPIISSLQELYSKYQSSEGVSIDTRTIRSNQMFFSIRGENFDGNTMASKAIESGASYAVIDNEDYFIEGKTILVKDVLLAMQELALMHRLRVDHPVLGITGSNGKTTTKELIHSVLSQKYMSYATSGNYNNHIGVPLTILNAPKESDFWIIEMGTNQPGDIALLAAIAQPNYGMITNIGLAHLEKLLSQEGIYNEKSVLYDTVVSNGGYLFMNTDDIFLKNYIARLDLDQCTSYSKHVCTYGSISEVSNRNLLLSLVLTDSDKKEHMIDTMLFGDFNTINVSAALTVGAYFNIELDEAINGISHYKPVNMRSQEIVTDRNVIIIDGYNANPSSMEVSLKAFLAKSSENSLVIIGDMLELGIEQEKYHQYFYNFLCQSNCEFFVVGPIFNKVSQDAANSYQSVQDLYNVIQSNPISGMTIFIKASRGTKLDELIKVL